MWVPEIVSQLYSSHSKKNCNHNPPPQKKNRIAVFLEKSQSQKKSHRSFLEKSQSQKNRIAVFWKNRNRKKIASQFFGKIASQFFWKIAIAKSLRCDWEPCLKPPKNVHMKIKSRASEKFFGFSRLSSVSRVPF